jgi:hypothetical protein
MNGDIEPFPGTINILSKYAKVNQEFWYKFNSSDTLERERKKYEEHILRTSTDQFSKDYLFFAGLGEDVKKWLLNEESLPYINLIIEALKQKVSPVSLKHIIATIISDREER